MTTKTANAVLTLDEAVEYLLPRAKCGRVALKNHLNEMADAGKIGKNVYNGVKDERRKYVFLQRELDRFWKMSELNPENDPETVRLELIDVKHRARQYARAALEAMQRGENNVAEAFMHSIAKL